MNFFSNNKITIIILSAGLIIVIAVLFFPNLFGVKITQVIRQDSEITQITTQSKDTSIESIQKDLEKTDVENIEREMDSIEKELNAVI